MRPPVAARNRGNGPDARPSTHSVRCGQSGAVAEVGHALLDETDLVEGHLATVAGRRLGLEADPHGYRRLIQAEEPDEVPAAAVGGGMVRVGAVDPGNPQPHRPSGYHEGVRVVRDAPGDDR